MNRNDILPLENELNRMVRDGRILDAFNRFYAENVEMSENDGLPTVGKEANRRREEAFLASVEAFHGSTLGSVAVSNGTSFSEWTLDLTFRGAPRARIHQVAVRTWESGQVVAERFFHAEA